MKIEDNIQLHSRIIEEHDNKIEDHNNKINKLSEQNSVNQYAISNMDRSVCRVVDNQREYLISLNKINVEIGILNDNKKNNKHWLYCVKEFAENRRNWPLIIASIIVVYDIKDMSISGIISNAHYAISKFF